jgi:hypothetical protein
MNADVGDGIEPADELGVEVFEVAEAAAEEEVLSDIAERSLHLSLRLCPVRAASAGLKAIMLRQREQVDVGDVTLVIFAGHRGLHTITKDLDRHPAQRLEGLDVAAQ